MLSIVLRRFLNPHCVLICRPFFSNVHVSLLFMILSIIFLRHDVSDWVCTSLVFPPACLIYVLG